ncbi:MAG: DUF1553 domain-containing protein [Planctomycetaceae bacterium]|nr:DUF1553 domain-containing protein [Planctomycetaceae bacterium]
MRYFLLLLMPIFVLSANGVYADEIDFNRDVRPILSKNCLACHGPDPEHREGGLHLTDEKSAKSELDSGMTAIVPGKPGESEMVARITTDDEFSLMPPADSGHELTQDEIETLKQWVAEGANYSRHWSFVKPERPPVPEVDRAGWRENPIDTFVLSKMHEKGLSPNDQADRFTLIRRLSFDLRGLPPTPEEVEQFVSDDSEEAYENLVDRFLADTAYGERWARVWLDLARYADSRGYGSDPLRPNIWRYRDWVIGAFNRNLPYDEFTIEQLAGDLLPEATLDQKVATAFHRNTMTNTEGGTDDEEFRVAAVKDRVDTTIQVWMGLTMGCAKCHSHKYDPISQEEYYRFYSLFNQTADRDLPNEAPTIEAPTEEWKHQVAAIDSQIDELKEQLQTNTPELQTRRDQWIQKTREAIQSEAEPVRARFVRIELPGQGKMLSLAEVQVFSGEENIALKGTASQSSTDYDGPAKLAIDGNTDGHYFDAKSTTHTKSSNDPWWEVDLGSEREIDKVVVWNRTDGSVYSRLNNFRILLINEQQKEGKAVRETVWTQEVKEAPKVSAEYAVDSRLTVPEDVLAILKKEREAWGDKETQRIATYYRTLDPELQKLKQRIASLQKSKPAVPTVPVMQELPPEEQRETFVQIRGNFLSPGEKVNPGLPHEFHQLDGEAKSRLDAAKWLVHPDNPLTSRVAVNRIWAKIFGRGLVVTEEDFGSQGEMPSHPKLLDWLAVEFQQDWDIKRLLKLMVTSATYRQSAEASSQQLEIDPDNTWLSRGPRFRLEAEMVRDQALALSGLLSRKIGGPSVYPPQPPGLWRAAFNGQRTWPESKGDDKYRRGLYTFWRRSVPYPSMATFDAPSREICNVRRIRTNTPLQVFVTLNDPVYVEAAQALARRIIREGGGSLEDRARWVLKLVLVKPPTSKELQTIKGLYQSERTYYQQHIEEAKLLATDPLGPLPEEMEPADAAAWTVVANVLLNLDAVLSK